MRARHSRRPPVDRLVLLLAAVAAVPTVACTWKVVDETLGDRGWSGSRCGWESSYGCGFEGDCTAGRAEFISRPEAGTDPAPEPDYGPITVRAPEGAPQ